MKHPKKRSFGRIVAVFLLTGLFTTLFLAGALVLYAERSIDAELDLQWLLDGQGRTTTLYACNAAGEWTELADERLHGTENRIWVSLDEIPRHVQNAFIAIEDHRFYVHHGVDWHRTAGAVLSFLTPGRDYGGSTITQQLIKNLTGDNSVTVKRKLTEVMRALKLEQTLSKEEILELYLNTVYLSQGCYGLETASERYFGKTASELSLAEGATLAAIIQYPTRYDPIQNPTNSRERRDVILARMLELDLIGVEEYDDAVGTPTELHLSAQKATDARHSWFTEVVIEDVLADLCDTYDLSESAASRLLYNGGLSIYTTMDRTMQEAVTAFYADEANFPANKSGERASSAAVLVDPENGHLLAVAGDIGEKKSDRIFNLATQMLRSPGSVIKPITVYAPALEKGLITWAEVFDDVPVTFSEEAGVCSAWPKNNPRVYAGLTDVATALEKSTNTVAVRILQRLGARTSFSFASSLGLSTLVERQSAENGKTYSDIAAAPLALGALTRGVSVREMTGAYTALANGGVASETISYLAVYDKDGNLLLSNGENSARRVLSEETADIMTRMLENVVERGTASALTLSARVPVAGKTGTSNADTDRWFIGYTPSLLCGVWYGYKDARDIGSFSVNPAVSVFDALMTTLYREHASDRKTLEAGGAFLTSENVVSCLYCKDSGLLPAHACSHDPRGGRVALGYFKKGTEPTAACGTHILVGYDSETHAVACEKCPAEALRQTALIRVYGRAFPTQVRITDAPYVYRALPEGQEPCLARDRAFFADAYEKDGTFIGVGVGDAYNRICAEHFCAETTAEETTAPEPPPETAVPETTIPETTIPETPASETAETTQKESLWHHLFR